MVDSLNLPCANCDGRRFTRTPHGWTACPSCYVSLMNETYIKPQVKELDPEPPDLSGQEPWPLTDRIETGSYSAFRRQVWLSLLHYSWRRLSYEYVEGWRLVEIQFERDPEFKSVRDLIQPELVILVTGLVDPHHDFTPVIIRNLQGARRLYGKPTWTFRGGKGEQPALKANPERRAIPQNLKDATL